MSRFALFVPCFNGLVAPKPAQAVTRILMRLGHQLDFPDQQTCCGQMHHNTGYWRESAEIARHFASVFGSYEAVVTLSGSCAAMVRAHYERDLGVPPPPVYELSELLVDVLGVVDVGAYFPRRVTYHPTCHSLRVLRLGERPLRLLQAVRGIELVQLPEAEECCGFGGTFALKNADVSTAMLTDKMHHVLSTGAQVVVAADTSCLLHIGGGLSRQRAGVQVMHYAEVLAARQESHQ